MAQDYSRNSIHTRIQIGLDGKEHTITSVKDAAGTEKNLLEVDEIIRATLEEMDRWQLIDIILNECDTLDLIDLAQDDDGIWYSV